MRAGRAPPRQARPRKRSARVVTASRRPRRRPDGPDRPRRARRAGRSATARARHARARHAHSAAGRTCRRGCPLLELEHLALEVDLVAALRAGLSQRLLELVLGGGTPADAETAVGAKDAEPTPLVGLRPVD